MKSGPFSLDRRLGLSRVIRSWPRVIRGWPRAALVGAVAATAAITLAACGGASATSLGPTGLTANTAAVGNGAAGTAGTAGGSSGAPATVPTTAGSVATSTGTTSTVSGGTPVNGTATAGGSTTTTSTTTTVTGGTMITGTRIGMSSGFSPPPIAPPAPGGGATVSPSNLPPAVQALSCPLPGPQTQAIPTGFVPVAAVRCVPTVGKPTTFTMQVATSNLGPLVASLLEPSATPGSFAAVPWCLGPAVNDIQLALVGSTGQVIQPSVPVDICGRPIQPVMASLVALNWATVS